MRRFSLVAFLTAAALLVNTSNSQATIRLYLSTTGSTLADFGGAAGFVASGADFTSVSYGNTNFNGFNITILGGSSNNGVSMSDLLGSVNSIRNNNAATATLYIMLVQDNYSLPAGSPLSVESGMGGSVNTGTLGLTGIFQAFASSTNDFVFDFTNNPQNASQTGSTFDTGSATGLFNRTGNYALASISTITLTAGGNINYSNHINVTAIPEPATVLSALFGVPALGYWVRRRRVAKELAA